jgi:hypothetical protein
VDVTFASLVAQLIQHLACRGLWLVSEATFALLIEKGKQNFLLRH